MRYTPEPVPVQFVGTTWVGRGPSYWVRRALLTLARCFLLLLMALLASSAFYAVGRSHLQTGVRVLILAAMGVLVLVGFGFGVRESIQINRTTLTPEEWRERRRELRRRLPWPIKLMMNSFVLIALLPIVGPFLFGFALSWLPGTTLGRELPAERGARARLEADQQRYDRLFHRDPA